MAADISRRKISQYAGSMIIEGKGDLAMRQVAAYLVQANRTREADLVVRDIETALAERGIVIATATTAHRLDSDLRGAVKQLLGAKELHLKEVVDPNVFGGVRIDMPGKQYDATVRRKLELLKELTLV